MLEINVMSRKEARKEFEKLDKKTISIDIYNSGDCDIEKTLRNNHISRIFLVFNDVSEGEFSFKREDAEMIKGFLERYANVAERLIVNCEMGVSRSAGIGAAILKAFTGNDKDIFNSKRYVPNMLCYRLMYETLSNATKIDCYFSNRQ